jgi:hypothetical protein
MKTLLIAAFLLTNVQLTSYAQESSTNGSSAKEAGIATITSNFAAAQPRGGDDTVEIELEQKLIEQQLVDGQNCLRGYLNAVVELKGAILSDSNGILSGVDGLRRIKWAKSKGHWGDWMKIIKSDLVDGKAIIKTEDGNVYTIFGLNSGGSRGEIIKNGSEEWKLFQRRGDLWGLTARKPLSSEMQKQLDDMNRKTDEEMKRLFPQDATSNSPAP